MKQCPIKIIKKNTYEFLSSTPLPKFHIEQIILQNITLKNTGKTIMIRPANTDDLYLKSNRGDRVYKLGGIHFHWGNSDTTGYETQIDDEWFGFNII